VIRQRWPVLSYVGRRMAAGVATLLIASLLIFCAIQIIPGDVTQMVLGRNASPARIAQIQASLHLQSSVPERYLHYIGGIAVGDLGVSTAGLVQGVHIPVANIVFPALRNSLVLAVICIMIFIPLTATLGLLSGYWGGRSVDHLISTVTLSIGALPEFIIGTGVIAFFFTQLHLFPPVSEMPSGDTPLRHLNLLVLPVMTLVLPSLAFGSRLLRASVIDVMAQDYITAAQINGVSKRRIITRHLLPNALIPTVQVIAQQAQYLIGGVVIVESVFDYPGIGNELVRAIAVRDVQVIMVTTTLLAIIYLGINIVADVICALLDPKQKAIS
jgi:peptide/nickel transport system permease protein